MYAPAVDRVADFIARQRDSSVPSREPGAVGQVVKYDSTVAQLDYRVNQSRKDFEMVDSFFRTFTDFNGTPMIDIARRYWDDPEFAEKQRREIAEGKKRRGH